MNQCVSPFSAGTIVLAAGGQPRHHEFQDSLSNVRAPIGTALRIVSSCDVAQNFNKGIAAATGDWVWFLGDDHEFAPDTLMKLLSRNVDVVVPITPCKWPFGYPFVLHNQHHDTTWHDDMQTYSWAELSGTTLKLLPTGDFVGQAGMLVQKHVLDTIGYPWFKTGQFDKGRLQEDMYFCKELQERGFNVWLDPTIIFDHYMLMSVTARRHNGKWVPALIAGSHVMVLPDVVSSISDAGSSPLSDAGELCKT